jgi:hypothetical protein
MKRVVLLAVLAIAAIAVWSCRKDVTITPPPTLTGDYVGTYCYKTANQPEECQLITVRFTSDQFIVRIDPSVADDDRKFCDFDGEYELGANIIMRPRCDPVKYPGSPYCQIDPNPTQQGCDSDKDGYGTFVVDQSVEGKLLLQLVSGSTHKTFDLTLD